MSALAEPSRKCVPTSGASCRPSAPARRFLLRRPATAPRAALERVRSVEPRDQNRSTVPSRRGAISSLARRWRNDSRRLSVVSTSLSASADPRGVSAAHTRRLSTSDRAMSHAVPVTFKHDACAPLCSSAGLCSSASATIASHLAAQGLVAARCPSLVGDELPPSASGDRGGLRVAGLPSCGLPCGRARSANPMRSTDFCFPILRPRTPVPRVVPGISPRLAPRPFARGLRPG
jgi:hypothetical protein